MELTIVTDNGQKYQLLPEPDLPDGLVTEDRTYELRLEGFSDKDDMAGCQLVLGGVNRGAGRYQDADTLSWNWEVKDYVGQVTVSLEPASGTAPWPVREIVVDPNRNKLTREQFAAMVDDINAEAAIAYSLSPATQRIDLGQQRQTLGLAQLEYVRQLMKPLQRAVEAIARRPRKLLIYEDAMVELARARAAGDRTMAWLLRHPSQLQTVTVGRVPPGARDLHRQLNGHLPEQIQVARRMISYDVYENQLIKDFLRRLGAVLRHTRSQLDKAAASRDLDESIQGLARRRVGEVMVHSRSIHRLLDIEFLEEVGPLRQLKPVTPTLRKDPLYARFLHLYRQFDRAITPFEGEPFQLSLEKTWQLYEYWCFFKVIAALRQLAGAAPEFDARSMMETHADGVSLALPGAEVPITCRLCAYFQKAYGFYGWDKASAATRVGTYSHEMRPDISIEICDDSGGIEQIVILDPKYRVSAQSLNQALDDMHRYKDAIVGPDRQRLVHTALVLCPSQERAKRLYFQEDYIQAHGLGALALRPGDDRASEMLAKRLEPLLSGSS